MTNPRIKNYATAHRYEVMFLNYIGISNKDENYQNYFAAL